MKSAKYAGIIYALLAAIFNGTVGVMSVKLFQSGLSANEIAFYKCLIGLFILFIIVICTRKLRQVVHFAKSKWLAGLICAFFGFFMLYHFETKAYATTKVSIVVFVLFGSATIFSFLLSAITEKRLLSFKEIVTIILSICGLYMIFTQDGSMKIDFNEGLVSAIIAGFGYGSFLFLSRKLRFGAGIPQMLILLFFGSVCLFIPFEKNVYIHSLSMWIVTLLILLAILPTIGGFWCTTKALTLTSSQSVQLIELSEPIFTLVFSLLFLGQQPTLVQIAGGGLIFVSIFIHEFNIIERLVSPRNFKKTV
ncbi:DMT family transporter [Salmonella enterica]|uniref:DMT family transporter n=1 Tax=Salmonella enterica TaxID=28901 RepID=UPI0009ABD2D0|nr:DMT family transporter [Salmonella enterica]ATI92485.1 EamA/RhaT family transporter [Salmonella enterica subsp. enterica]EDK5734008.1 EamA/RhaT family transporter [Salmonella enterica subsp. enterica serovar Muenchen]EHF3504515.1 DMT family transporter [Salmonella enterica subsp. enterica serovar 6,8,20:d-]HBJ6961798.1 DMT family transporter [Salmonella enterica subsp. enterica serovar Duisburg]EAA2700429.1 EamA/RhaT family transporter [Salmonella enterica]